MFICPMQRLNCTVAVTVCISYRFPAELRNERHFRVYSRFHHHREGFWRCGDHRGPCPQRDQEEESRWSQQPWQDTGKSIEAKMDWDEAGLSSTALVSCALLKPDLWLYTEGLVTAFWSEYDPFAIYKGTLTALMITVKQFISTLLWWVVYEINEHSFGWVTMHFYFSKCTPVCHSETLKVYCRSFWWIHCFSQDN